MGGMGNPKNTDLITESVTHLGNVLLALDGETERSRNNVHQFFKKLNSHRVPSILLEMQNVIDAQNEAVKTYVETCPRETKKQRSRHNGISVGEIRSKIKQETAEKLFPVDIVTMIRLRFYESQMFCDYIARTCNEAPR